MGLAPPLLLFMALWLGKRWLAERLAGKEVALPWLVWDK